MDFNETLARLQEAQVITLAKVTNPTDIEKGLSAIDKKNLELKKKKKIIKNFDPKTGKAILDTRTAIDDKITTSLSKIN